LPIVRVFRNAAEVAEQTMKLLYACVTEEVNQNLTPAQKLLLRWHFRLGHASSVVVKWMANRGLLGDQSKAIAGVIDLPKCGTCQYAKQAEDLQRLLLPEFILKRGSFEGFHIGVRSRDCN